MFIKRIDGVIRGAWSQRQVKINEKGEPVLDERGVPVHEDLEWLDDNDPELVAYLNRPARQDHEEKLREPEFGEMPGMLQPGEPE